MTITIHKNIKFTNYYKKFNILSSFLIIFSILIIIFKGLNLGVDFKGGTLIEVRVEDKNISISEIRQSLINMQLGDVNVKKFGKENDYLVKIELSETNNESLTCILNTTINGFVNKM